MQRAVGVLTIGGAVLLAAITLQPQPFTVAQSEDALSAERRVMQQASPDLVETWLEVAEEVDPAKAERLRHMCHHDPEEFHRVMRQSGRRIVGLAELKAQDPDLYEVKLSELRIEAQVDAATEALVEAIRSGRDADIAALEEDLRRSVLMQVLHSIKARGDYLIRLKEHVQRLEQELEREAANWQQTVEQRTQEIVERSHTRAASE